MGVFDRAFPFPQFPQISLSPISPARDAFAKMFKKPTIEWLRYQDTEFDTRSGIMV